MENAMAEDIANRPRPGSDMLSRGAGQKYSFRSKHIRGSEDNTLPGARSSPGMGTFGVEASQDPLSSSEVSSDSVRVLSS